MATFAPPIQWILTAVLILSSLGVILARKPVHASLSFLVTLLAIAVIYFQLSASFIGVIQILVYAGAILVIFMFVIVLFQDAYLKISAHRPQSTPILLWGAAGALILILIAMGRQLLSLNVKQNDLSDVFGSVEAIGEALYIDFFFPFEAITPLFLVAAVGALYIAKKVK